MGAANLPTKLDEHIFDVFLCSGSFLFEDLEEACKEALRWTEVDELSDGRCQTYGTEFPQTSHTRQSHVTGNPLHYMRESQWSSEKVYQAWLGSGTLQCIESGCGNNSEGHLLTPCPYLEDTCSGALWALQFQLD